MAPAFIRGTAFVCRRSEDMIDITLPILLWDAKISEWVMSSFFVKITDQATARTYEIIAEHLRFFPKEDHVDENLFTKPSPTKRPYIALIMDLGVQNPLSAYAQFPTENSNGEFQTNISAENTVGAMAAAPQGPVAPCTQSKLYAESLAMVTVETKRTAPTPQNTHPRYSIFASGCSDTVYNVIEPSDRTKYQQLLGQDHLLAEHPRPHTVSDVLNLKPFWLIGEECYSWYNSPRLNRKDQCARQSDGMRVPRFGESLEADYEGRKGEKA